MSALPTVVLGDVLTPVCREESVDPSAAYRVLGARWYAKGLYIKDQKLGSQIKAPKVYRVRTGDFVYNRLFAWKGSFAIAGNDVNDCHVSNEFPCFEVKSNRLEPRYLLHYFSREPAWTEALGLSTGATPTSRNRLKERHLLAMRISLPPLGEQRRIVARIEELAAKIEEARGLRTNASLGAEALRRAARALAATGGMTDNWREANPDTRTAAEMLAGLKPHPAQVNSRRRTPLALPEPPSVPPSWVVRTAGDLQDAGAILDIQDGNHGGDYPRKSEFAADGVPFVTAIQMHEDGVRINEAPRLPSERAKLLRIGFARGGDVLLTHNASVGDVALAPANAGDFLLGTSVTYWRCNPDGLIPSYLVHFMKSDLFQEQLRAIMKQTTRNQVSVLKQVNLWICIPPIEEQREIVSILDNVLSRMNASRSMEAQAAAELEALLPSILDKAFKGEL